MSPTNNLERRLQEIDREAARLRKEMKTLRRRPERSMPPPASEPPAGNDGGAEGAERDDLFTWQQRYEAAATRKNQDRRLAHYLTTGSFASAGRTPRDRRVLRNRAIFMLVVVIMAAFIVYRLFLS